MALATGAETRKTGRRRPMRFREDARLAEPAPRARNGRVPSSPAQRISGRTRLESERMTVQLSRYLKDFSAPKVDMAALSAAPRYFADKDARAARLDMHAQRPQQPEIDIEAERRAAYERGRAEGLAERNALLAAQQSAVSAHAAILEELEARHAAEKQELMTRFDHQVAGRIDARFTEMADGLADMLMTETARALAPIMEEALMRRAIDDMAVMVRRAFAEGDCGRITVRGPETLYERLKDKIDDADLVFRHEENGDVDLTVEFGEAVLVTRMNAWAETVRKVLE